MWARSQTSGDWSGETCRVSSSSESGSSNSSVRRRAWSRAAASSDGDTELGEAAEDERRDHRAFADRGSDALRRAVSHVARGEEADTARLQRKRVTVQRPAVGSCAVGDEVLSGEDVTRVVREDVLAWTPVGVRSAADAQEDAVNRLGASLARRVGERHTGQTAVAV